MFWRLQGGIVLRLSKTGIEVIWKQLFEHGQGPVDSHAPFSWAIMGIRRLGLVYREFDAGLGNPVSLVHATAPTDWV